MLRLTEEQNVQVMQQGREICERIANGESTRDIMAEIYVTSLEDKTKAQGYVVADAIIAAVASFDSDYADAKADIDSFIDKLQDRVFEGKSAKERCTYLLQLNHVLAAEGNKADALSEAEKLSVTEDEATEEYEKELKARNKELLMEAGATLSGLIAHADELEEITDGSKAAELLIDLGTEEINYRAIVAMLTYTKVKTGEYDNIPADMTAEQVTRVVCAQIEEVRILNELTSGNIAEDVASTLLFFLGAVAIIPFITTLSELAVSVACIFTPTVLVIPAVALVIYASLRGMYEGMKLWEAETHKIVHFVAVGVKAVVKGFKHIVEFVREKLEERRTQTHTETVTTTQTVEAN